MVQLGFPAEQYAGHSFRRGGATSLAMAGVPENLIKVLGRWLSFAYQGYMEVDRDQLAKAMQAMSNHAWKEGPPHVDQRVNPWSPQAQ